MPIEERAYIRQVGTVIKIDMQETITGATGLKFNVRKPDGKEVEWVPTIEGTQHLKYTTQEGDFDISGVYKIQPELTLSGFSGPGYTVKFPVFERFS